MKKNLLLLLLLFFSTHIFSQPVLTYSTLINSGLTNPVDVVPVNDGTGRIFIVEQGGIIKLYSNTYTLLNSDFLTISTNIAIGGEQGLLSLAFHPNYATNRYFFVYYTNAAGGVNIDRFQTLLADPNQADASTRTNIMTIDKPIPFTNHNGGKLNFGAGGHLFFGLGDCGSSGDPRNFAQRGDSLWGKMVRINVDNFTTPPYYTVPADNPYVGSGTILNEIFSFGLRNPFRWSFDRLNGDLWLADVGQNAKEEVNTLTAAAFNGANFGWRCYEGLSPYNTTGCLAPTNYISPVFEYGHNSSTGGFSITGGYVYRGSVYPAMYGYYICADYISGNVWVINATSYAATQQSTQLANIAGFGELPNGELLALSRNGILYAVSSSTVLPLKLVQWDGYAYNSYNMLNWQTADETNVKQFEVEYSTDGVTFKNAGNIVAKNTTYAVYTFRHDIQAGLHYYRLKMINTDGSLKYSNIITLKSSRPENDRFIYQYNGNSRLIWMNTPANEKVNFQLFNVNGQPVLQKENYLNNSIIDLQQLPAGVYIGKIIMTNKTVSEKIIVN